MLCGMLVKGGAILLGGDPADILCHAQLWWLLCAVGEVLELLLIGYQVI